MKRLRRFNLLVVTALAGLAHPASVRSQEPRVELQSIALAALQAHNDVLVRGDIDAALSASPLAGSFREAMQAHLARAQGKRAHIARFNQRYVAARTSVADVQVEVSGDSAVMTATELTELDTPDPSIKTAYRLHHRFVFVRSGLVWQMRKDSVTNLEARFETNGPPSGADSGIARRSGPGGERVPRPQRPTGSRNQGRSELFRLAEWSGAALRQGSVPMRRQAPAVTVSLPTIKQYAFDHAYYYNPNYRTHAGNDCANFVSQALRAGGWTMTSGLYTSNTEWWYSAVNQTHTWVNASLLHHFARYWTPYRTAAASSWSQVLEGDIVFFDWTGNGSIDHSAVVTKLDPSGDVLLSYHTTDRQNYALSSIEYDNPNLLAYIRMVWSSY